MVTGCSLSEALVFRFRGSPIEPGEMNPFPTCELQDLSLLTSDGKLIPLLSPVAGDSAGIVAEETVYAGK